MKIKIKNNDGLMMGEFKDVYGGPCRISESSLATQAGLWLGLDETGSSMHLTMDTVKGLLPLLQEFVDTSYIGRSKKNEPDKEYIYCLTYDSDWGGRCERHLSKFFFLKRPSQDEIKSTLEENGLSYESKQVWEIRKIEIGEPVISLDVHGL